MIVARVAKEKGAYHSDAASDVLHTELEMRNDISKMQYRGYDTTNVNG